MIWTKLTKTVLDELKKKKNGRHMAGQKFSKINTEIDEKSTFFFSCFIEFVGYCFGELGPNRVSKFQVRTRKTERSRAILACFERLGRPSLFVGLSPTTQLSLTFIHLFCRLARFRAFGDARKKGAGNSFHFFFNPPVVE